MMWVMPPWVIKKVLAHANYLFSSCIYLFGCVWVCLGVVDGVVFRVRGRAFA
jgi:hypothetical protein